MPEELHRCEEICIICLPHFLVEIRHKLLLRYQALALRYSGELLKHLIKAFIRGNRFRLPGSISQQQVSELVSLHCLAVVALEQVCEDCLAGACEWEAIVANSMEEELLINRSEYFENNRLELLLRNNSISGHILELQQMFLQGFALRQHKFALLGQASNHFFQHVDSNES